MLCRPSFVFHIQNELYISKMNIKMVSTQLTISFVVLLQILSNKLLIILKIYVARLVQTIKRKFNFNLCKLQQYFTQS